MQLVIVLILLIVFIAYIMNTFIVERVYYNLKSLSVNNLKVVHITDLHGSIKFINGNLSGIINNIYPDIVFITGDLVSNQRKLTSVVDELGKINCPHIFFVPGNYEREENVRFIKRYLSSDEYVKIIDLVKSKNISVLENNHSLVTINGSRVLIYGFDNSIYGNEVYDERLNKFKCDYKILLAHSPNIINKITQWDIGYNLLLVGHTHGGQIRIFNKTFGAYKQFHSGLKEVGEQQFFLINRGLGNVRIPLRINCKPVISVISVEKEKVLE